MLFYCYCGYLLQTSKWLLEAEGYHRYLVNCTAGPGRWIVLYNTLKEEWNQQLLCTPLQKELNTLENSHMPDSSFIFMVFQTTSVSSEAALEPSLRLNTLPGHCFMLWLLFRASLLLPSPRLTPPWALWTQQSPAHSFSLGWSWLALSARGTEQQSYQCGATQILDFLSRNPWKKHLALKRN